MVVYLAIAPVALTGFKLINITICRHVYRPIRMKAKLFLEHLVILVDVRGRR